MKDIANPISLLLMAVITLLLGVLTWQQFDDSLPTVSGSEDVLVQLTGGNAYFGRPVSHTRDLLTLDNVHYIRRVQNEKGGQASNVLVRRGKDFHGPTRMLIPTSSIQFIEPLATDSVVAKKMSAD